MEATVMLSVQCSGVARSRWIALAMCASVFLVSVAFGTDVVTYHNDNSRTGQNTQETILTTSNVNSTAFGRLFTFPVDSTIDAQPLYLSAVNIPNQGTHNVIYTVTENDSVYAFDADTGASLSQVSLLQPGEVASDTHSCSQVVPKIGITSTPVIDRTAGTNGTIYIVAMSKKSSTYFQRLHALDITTGQEEFSGPTTITAKYPGTGDNSQNGFVIFDPGQYEERAGLLLNGNTIYTAWSSHCDQRPYTGWIMGFNKLTLKPSGILNVTPNGNEGAIWQAGAGLAADKTGVFFMDGNGTFDTTLNSQGFPSSGDYGNGILRVGAQNGKLAVIDYFNMFNTVSESNADEDLGSGGLLLLPSMKDSGGIQRNLAIGAGKDSNIYIVDRTNMGKFDSSSNHIWQEIDGALPNGVWAMPAFYNGNVYYAPQGWNLLQFKFTQAKLSTTAQSMSSISFTYPGSTPSVSANGTSNGIVWAIEHTGTSVLHAYKASDLSKELYNSNQAAGNRDHFGSASHFGTPTIVNGKVYVGTTSGVAVFGLLQ
jgi:hypothetical protein